jgi:hypothetical protein
MKKLIFHFSVAILIIVSSCKKDDSNQSASSFGTIQGKVTNITGDTVIVNANVSTNPPTSSVSTNANGEYIISDVTPGTYTVTATKGGYNPGTVSVSATVNKTRTADIHMDIQSANSLPTQGLVAYYPFNGNANDESGNGNNGIIYGARLTTDRFGNNNKAYIFDGISNYINVSNSTHPTGNVTITYSAWLYYSSNLSIGQHVSVVDVGNSGDANPSKRSAILLWKNIDNKDYVTYCSQANDYVFQTYIIPFNQWLHIILTKTANITKLYINGSFVQQGSINSTQNVESTKISIGGSGNFQHANGECLKGKIDDVRIYNRVLTDTEIQQLYHEGGW